MGVIWKEDSTPFWGLIKASFYLWLNMPGEGAVSNDPESPLLWVIDFLPGAELPEEPSPIFPRLFGFRLPEVLD